MKLINNYEYLRKTKTTRRYSSEMLGTTVTPKKISEEILNSDDVLCLSTADSDFQFPKYIAEDLTKFFKNGDMNYSFKHDSFVLDVDYWYKSRYNALNLHKTITPENVIIGNGVINFLQYAIEAYTNEGEGVIFFSPVYYSFLSSVVNSKRKVEKCTLIYNEEQKQYQIDFVLLEKLMKDANNKMLLFCNPHNPIGRVWNREEIDKILCMARKYNVMIASDEIWQDITFNDNLYQPLIYLAKETDNVVITTSFAKTYNLGGAQMGFAVSYNKDVVKKIMEAKAKHIIYASDNVISIEIFKSGATNPKNVLWLEEYKEYIHENHLVFRDILKDTNLLIPKLEGTYLCWVNFSKYDGITSEKIDEILTSNRIFVEPGTDFCDEYLLCRRINISVSRDHVIRVANVLKDNFSAN